MPTPDERRALLFLASLAALGLGARAVRGHLDGRSGNGAHAAAGIGASAALDRQIASVDSAGAAKRARAGAGSSARKSRAGSSGAVQPGARDSSGAASGSDRRRSSRAGPPEPAAAPVDPLALYEARRLAVAEKNRAVQARIEADRAAEARAEHRPAAPRTTAAPAAGARAGPGRRVDLDTAGPDELAALPWIGATLAARIVSDRAIRGPFGSLVALQRVRGVGPGLAARIAPFVSFSRPDSRTPETIRFRPIRVSPVRP